MGEAKVKMEGTFAARPATHDEWGHFLRDRGHLGLTGEAMALSDCPLDQPLPVISQEYLKFKVINLRHPSRLRVLINFD